MTKDRCKTFVDIGHPIGLGRLERSVRESDEWKNFLIRHGLITTTTKKHSGNGRCDERVPHFTPIRIWQRDGNRRDDLQSSDLYDEFRVLVTKLTLSHSVGATCWPGKYLFTGVLTCGDDDGQPAHPRIALRLRPIERIRFAKVTLCHSVGATSWEALGVLDFPRLQR
jgi:hypothetical protein